MKNICSLLFLASVFCVGLANEAFGCTPASPGLFSARSGGCGLPIDFPDLRRSLPNWEPKPKTLPLPEVPKDSPEFRHVDVETLYSVSFRSQDPTPPSCNVIAGRLKNFTARISEMSQLTQKMERGQILSYQEVRDYVEMTRKYIPNALDDVDQIVELNITWKFLSFKPANHDGIFYFLLNSPTDFHQFIVTGPGLKWTSTGETLPPFFQIAIDEDVHVRYEMQMMDFCFGENTMTVRGRFSDEFGPLDPVLKASWERDILKFRQTGRWTIRTVGQLQKLK